MKILYFDCFAGAAGDMILGALIDAGASEDAVRHSIDALDLPANVTFEAVTKNGVRATKARVDASTTTARTLVDITSSLERSAVPDEVRSLALRIFRRLFEAEAQVHGEDVGRVHLHEAGDDDALVDVVGSSAALLDLRPDLTLSSPLPTGSGWVESSHGRLPVPAPAVLELLKGVPVVERGARELVTPTGAAILAVVVDRFQPMPELTLSAIGYGAGDADDEFPNVLRVLVGEASDQPTVEEAMLIETNIDDMAPELVPYVIERLLDAGAQDAWTSAIGMKKQRPALQLSVLCDPGDQDRVLDVIYRETTTLGVRLRGIGKHELDRTSIIVQVAGRPVSVKLGLRAGRAVTVSPEFEDAAAAARATGIPLKDVYRRAISAAEALTAEGDPAPRVR